jgi:[CysO sulfur-carrier protein]-S-L-cysteine hydrolase
MLIAPELFEQIVAHACEERETECCGMVACERFGEEGLWRAVRVTRAVNVFAGRRDASGNDLGRKRFEIDGKDLVKAYLEYDRDGLELGAIYHSHTHTAAKPSQTDINFARNWPGMEWLIVGLADGQPAVHSYLIEDGEVREVPIEVG